MVPREATCEATCEHILAMRYDPASHRTGVFVSLLVHLLAYGGAFGLGAMLWYRRGHRKP